MLKSYLKIAWRNLWKNKTFSFINIAGLAIGLTCFILISVFVYDELHYDRYPAEADNIYRVNLSTVGNGDVVDYPMVDVAVGEGIKNELPGVKATTRVSPASDFVKYDDKQFKEQHLAFADSNFLQMFSIPLVQGNDASALTQPNSIVISKIFAKKYFGNENPINKTINIGTNESPYKVTGVYDKIPDNSHFHFDAFLSIATFHISYHTWSNLGFHTYILLDKDTDPKALEAKFPQLVAKHVVPEIQHDMGVSLAEAQKSINTFIFTLHPLTDLHLHSNTKYELEPGGDIQYVYIFSALAVFILLLACVNFTNLSTARAIKRAREVGVRKVMGSVRKQLIFQFLTESVLLTFLSIAIAFVLIYFLLPYFNGVAGKHISFSFFLSPATMAVMFLACLFCGLLAGIYPAFFLSAFNPIKVLKGSIVGRSPRQNRLRSGLIIFQFFVSTALIIATLIVAQQLHHMQTKKLGYDKDQVVFLPDARLLGTSQEAFKQRLLQDNRILSVSISRSVPGGEDMDGTEIYPKNQNGNGTEIHANIAHIDYDYVRTLGLRVIAGRNFSREITTDSAIGIMINEAAVRQLGWTVENAVGKHIVRSGQKEFEVVGVVQDFNYASVKQEVAPIMLMMGRNLGGIIIKIRPTDINNFLGDLKKEWNAFNPKGPLEYNFLDEKFAELFASEKRTQKIFSSFTLLAVIIAGLGLFGLSAFIIEQRTREIGIRKVLGASVSGLLLMVSKEFLILIAIAFLISIPVTAWAMHAWLQDFAYRINIGVSVFLIAGITVLLIALLAISVQAIKAAMANPVKSLRTE